MKRLVSFHQSWLGRHCDARLFWRMFLVISAAFFVLWQTSLYLDALFENRQKLVATQEATRRAHDLLGETLKTFAADLRIVAQNQNLDRLFCGDDLAREEVVRDFEVFVSEKPFVAQLRFLDCQGDEIIRVDRRGNDIVVVPRADLQAKAHRYYFQQSIDLPRDGLYVSAIDLNIEHGGIEIPWRPMLRMAVPVRQVEGKIPGVVVVNLSASGIIAAIERTRSASGDPLQLLNGNGYWLAGVPRERLWGFMFGNDMTLAKTAPDVWRRIAGAADGMFDDNGVHYVFDTLRPEPLLRSMDHVSMVRASDAEWKILGKLPAVTLRELWRYDRVPVGAGGLLVIAAICLGWSRMAFARREAEETRKKTESEIIRIERMASLGGLVAGVAHELNTPIGNAMTVASTLSQQVDRLDTEVASGRIKLSLFQDFLADMRDGTEIMQRGLKRAAELVSHFKQVAVDQTSEQRRRFRLADFIEDIVGSVQPQFKHGPVALGTDIGSSADLDSYPGPLGQVLMNLVANARIHGFDGPDAGKITIIARDLSPDEVEIAVHDTGKGIPPDRIERIFDPFFTTQMGKGGSGLGLSISFNIATNVLGGTIRADSSPETGTTVTLRIPVTAPRGPENHIGKAYDVERSEKATR